MQHSPIPIPADEPPQREAVRNFVSLPVTLCWGAERAPAEIKNLTGFGALVHCAAGPARNSEVRLVRGQNEVVGEVARKDGDLLGLRFASPISVRDWMLPPRESGSARHANAGPSPATPSVDPRREKATRMMQDLVLVSSLIDELGIALAADPDISDIHMPKIQNLDVAMQMLAVVCWQLSEDTATERKDLASPDSLRRSCQASLKSGAAGI